MLLHLRTLLWRSLTHAYHTHTHTYTKESMYICVYRVQYKVEVTKRFIVIVILFDHMSLQYMSLKYRVSFSSIRLPVYTVSARIVSEFLSFSLALFAYIYANANIIFGRLEWYIEKLFFSLSFNRHFNWTWTMDFFCHYMLLACERECVCVSECPW